MIRFPKAWVPHPPRYKEGEGINYAVVLAEKSQTLSFCSTLFGWFCVVSGALLAISGSIFGSESIDKTADFFETLKAHPGILCSAFAIVSAGAGWQILDRAKAATKVASISTQAILVASSNNEYGDRTPDKVAYDVCVDAKIAWLEGRMNTDRLESIVASLKPPEAGKSG